VLADARDHEIAHASQPGERLRIPAHRFAEPGQLREPPGDDHGSRIVPDAQALGHARRDGDHVLEGAADLAADHVVVRVDAEHAASKHVLEGRRDREVLGGHHAGRGIPGHDLLGDVGPGQGRRRPAGQHVLDDLRHAHVRAAFEALGEAYHRDPGPDERRGLLQRIAEAMGGNPDDQEVRGRDRLLEVGAGPEPVRQ